MIISSFKEKLNNTPHLMTQESFLQLAEFLETDMSTDMLSMMSNDVESKRVSVNYNPDTKIGVIDINGGLTYQSQWYQAYYGGISYQSIKAQAQQLVDDGMSTLFLKVDSGGGEAYAAFETANFIRKLADDNGVKIVAYVDGMSASAAYIFTAISDTVIANPQAEIGSVGVVVRLRNVNQAMAQAGVQDTYVTYGSNKIPFDTKGDWKKEFKDGVQTKVNTLGVAFTEFVAGYRSLSVEDVKSMEASTYLAGDALKLGLIDSVMTHEEFYTYLADFVQKETQPKMFKNKIFNLSSEQEKVEMNQLEIAQSELHTLQTKLSEEVASKASFEALVAEQKVSLDALVIKLASFEAEALALKLQAEAEAKAQAELKESGRKARLVAVLAEDQVEDAVAAMAGASDAQFEFAMRGFESALKAKTESALFAEVGGQGEQAHVVLSADEQQAAHNKLKYTK